MKLAFLYAGQGSQHPGMGQDLYDAYPAFRTAFDAATLDFDLHSVCFQGPADVLNQTRYTQPCMVAFAAGVTAVLAARGLTPDYTAGLSLGEYSALQAAGALDAAEAIQLAAFRGQAMANAAAGVTSGMTAVLGLARAPLLECCCRAAGHGVVQICNYNCPGQLVIGGEKAAVDAAAALALAAGAKRCLPLNVSGPFHTSLMRPAGEALAARFAHTTFAPLRCPVLFNCLGREMGPGDSIPLLLERQVQSSVYMEDTLRRLAELGVDTAIEVGPGRALTGFLKKTVGSAITCYPVETAAELENALAALTPAQSPKGACPHAKR
ncbi:MAG: ACP S-malonyltransferase [Gemmiger sp.]|nr:ACP S-malonyltransferase [Gemmiger sp.]